MTLTWDASPEENLAGYRLYYKTGTTGAPYDGTGLAQGDSPVTIYLADLADTTSPEFTLTGLGEDTTYFFAFTSFDTNGLESDYSHGTFFEGPAIAANCTITASATGQGTIFPAGAVSVFPGASQTFTIAADANYHIACVTVDGVSVGQIDTYTFENITAAQTISAAFEIDTYTITARTGENGSISPRDITCAEHGTDLSYNITPTDGYHILDVFVDGISVGAVSSCAFSQITTNHTISAEFERSSYLISASFEGKGRISPSGISIVDHRSRQGYKITPATGYQVKDVLVDGTSAGPSTTFSFDQVIRDHSIHAVFEEATYTISSSAGANGMITPFGEAKFSHGSHQSYAIYPDIGYAIGNVVVDGVSVGSVDAYTFSNIHSDRTIRAEFIRENQSPLVDTGPDPTVEEGGIDTLYGQNSADVNGTIAAFPRRQAQGDAATLNSSTETTGGLPIFDINSDPAIGGEVSPDNQPPRADAGPNQSVAEGRVVTLSGLNSIDADDGIAEFQWRQVQGIDVNLISPTEPEATFVAPDVKDSGSALIFELVVTDFSGAESADSCIVNVTWVNTPPVADAGADRSVIEGSRVELDATGSTDADDGIVTYAWRQLLGPVVELSEANSATAFFIAPDDGLTGATLAFEITVADAGGLQDTANCLINVTWVNTPPVADAGPDQNAAPGDDVILDGSKSYDADDTEITSYRWRQTNGYPVELSDPAAMSPVLKVPAGDENDGTMTFELTVNDSGGLQGKDSCHVNVQSIEP